MVSRTYSIYFHQNLKLFVHIMSISRLIIGLSECRPWNTSVLNQSWYMRTAIGWLGATSSSEIIWNK